MGRITKNFRQSARSLSGSKNAQAYAKITRLGSWGSKIKDQIVKIKDKSGVKMYGKS